MYYDAKRFIWRIFIFTLIFLFLILYSTYDPEKVSIYPQCPFYMLTKLKCPGCGSQRAIHNLLNLNIQKAFEYNALLVCTIPIIPIFIVAQIYRRRFPRFYNTLFGTPFIIGILLITISWWIIRLTLKV